MNRIITGIIALFLLSGISSCIKDNFDAPLTGGVDPKIDVNFRIDSLKARYPGTNYYINEDLVISGIVTADDKSGNFYKQMVIQDTSGGIVVLLGGGSYNDFPIGRRVFIKLKGLYLVQYKGIYQIAGSIAPDGSTDGIPTAFYDKFILKGSYFHTVTPKVVTISQLNSSYQSLLIKFEKVEFETTDAGKPYANAFSKTSLSRTIKNCSGGTLETYNSGYASFASHLTPTGNGSLVCIYSLYGNTPQLLLRDESDVQMDSVRCGGGPVIITGTGIMSVRNLYAGADVTLPAGTVVKGIVISDRVGGNMDSKNLVIQDSTGGIVVRFAAAHSFNVGDDVTVNVAGLTLKSFSNLLEIDKSVSPYGVPLANATKLGTGTVTPRVATCSQIQANGNTWESTLIKVNSGTLSGTPTTYNGNLTLTDASGTVTHRTVSTATFATTTYPTSSKNYTGILGEFTTGFQLSIRNLNDVQ